MSNLLIIIFCLAFCLPPAWGVPESTIETLRMLKNSALEEHLKGKDDDALDLYEQAINLAKQQFGADSDFVAELYLEMGLVAMQASKFQKAENLLTQATLLKPSSEIAETKLAELMHLRGRAGVAHNLALTALEQHHHSLTAATALALSDLDMGNRAAALQDFYRLKLLKSGRSIKLPAPAVSSPSVNFSQAATSSKNQQKKKTVKPTIPAIKKAKKEIKTTHAKTRKAQRSFWGLIPPPPAPIPTVYPGTIPSFAPPTVKVQTGVKAKVNNNSLHQEMAKEKPKETPDNTSNPNESPDFLLDWASDKGHKK